MAAEHDLLGWAEQQQADVSQIITVDRSMLDTRVGHLSERDLRLVLAGIDLVLGRD